MPLDFTFQIHLMTLFEKLLVMLLGLIGVKINDVFIWITSLYFLKALFDQQSNFKNDFQFESFPCPDKQGTPEEGRRIKQLKRCVTTNNNKEKDNSLKKKIHKILHNILLARIVVQ